MALRIEVSNGILRSKIRPRISWTTLPFLLLFLWIVIGSGLLPASTRLQAAMQNNYGVGDIVFRLLIYLSTAIAGLYVFLRMFFGSDVVILSQTTLEIQRWIFRLSLTQRSFPNSTVNNLRYVEWRVSRFGMQRAICFESAGKTVTFARQSAEGDSRELIDAMHEIYPFPTK
jgi:hypothetical protein